MAAINFFRQNNFDFKDLPTNQLNLITLHSQLLGLVNQTVNNYQTVEASKFSAHGKKHHKNKDKDKKQKDQKEPKEPKEKKGTFKKTP